MAKATANPSTVVSTLGFLAAAAVAAVGCGGSSGGSRATGGATGTGGHVATGGSTGTGTGGNNGTAGATGAGGAMACNYATAALDCPNGVNPAAPLITDFSPATWANTQGKWHTVACDLTGAPFSGAKAGAPDAGVASSASRTIDITLANPSLEVKGTILSGEFGYGGLQFGKCVNTPTYTGVQFTLGGTTAGCDLLFQVQTFSQQGTSGGGCTTNCYHFPQKKVTVGTAPVVVHFADLQGTGLPADAAVLKTEIVGLQWQLQSPAGPDGGAQPSCDNFDLTIDDVKFVSD